MKIIDHRDLVAAHEVMDLAYDYLLNMRAFEGEQLYKGRREKIAKELGKMPFCIESSDAVTRAAHDLGIVASREAHGVHTKGHGFEINHYLTSLGPVDESPKETDPIICLVWGQFNNDAFADYHSGYFGPRFGIHDRVGLAHYRAGYAAGSIVLRQVTHTPSGNPSSVHVWLSTTPQDLKNRAFPIGTVRSDTFPKNMWQFPGDLPN